ncbi:MAG: cytochrome ubiquinol oxidase subunit I [Flaviflexus sp.]|uniref:cytochrome ubiquinol oxidase subunit I n=1 Tax=Flaviflexus sp. TaxID=1969482 RepID=UPI003F93F5B2
MVEALDLARWQFGITTVYHFILVPLTIGLAPLVAIMQTKWLRSGEEKWMKLAEFFGKILIINFALGVATGIVQEFQFGMNWSEYSRFVGDIFGAPLAFEALMAFFLESTFLGLWVFGKGRMSAKLNTLCIWMVAIGVNISAYFILCANSFMQHPVGAVYNEETGRAELDGVGGFLEVLTNNTAIAATSHTITAAFLVAGTLVAGIGTWWMVRSTKKNIAGQPEMWRSAARFGFVTILISAAGVGLTGHFQGQLMYEQQPMKMASAEAQCHNEEGAPLSILAIGDLTNDCENVTRIIDVPWVTSFMATNHLTGPESEVAGVEDVQAFYQEKYADQFGEDYDYRPNLVVTYYSFRAMIGPIIFPVILALAGLWFTRKEKIWDSSGWAKYALFAIPMPFIASSFGWIFTEMGRQPWVVAPNPTGVEDVLLLTDYGVSQTTSPAMVLTTLIGFTVLYAILGVVWFLLVRRYTLEGIDLTTEKAPAPDDENQPLSFVY